MSESAKVPMDQLVAALEEEMQKKDFRVAIFGSARSKPEDPEYKLVYNLAKMIAEEDMDLVNGGGPGIMEAASRGHNAVPDRGKEVHTLGLNIKLPFEQEANPYLDIETTFDTFSHRLDQFMLLTSVFVVAPGGIGTCLELFYTWQLMQVDHICRVPIILIGDMWHDLIKWVEKELLEKNKFISKADLYPIVCVDTAEQAMSVIKVAKANFDLAGDNACLNIERYAAAVKQLGFKS